MNNLMLVTPRLGSVAISSMTVTRLPFLMRRSIHYRPAYSALSQRRVVQASNPGMRDMLTLDFARGSFDGVAAFYTLAHPPFNSLHQDVSGASMTYDHCDP